MNENEVIKLPSLLEKPCFSSPVAYKHELHLKGPLGGPEDYVDWVRTIRNAGPNDMIEFHLNTPGGNVYTAIELLNAFATTEAHVHCVISGICASAGTILMAVGDSYEISPWASFMFHNYSGGMAGKGNEMYAQMIYERDWSVNFMRDIYEDILTPEEIDRLVDGADFWLTADDVGDRLAARLEKKEKLKEELMEELMKALEEEEKPKKKAPAKRKTKKKE